MTHNPRSAKSLEQHYGNF